jgi:hypothetical protein
MAAFTIAQLDTASMRHKDIDPTEKPGRGVLFFRYVTIDFDKLATSAGVSLTNTDTYQIMNLAVGELVLQAGIEVKTVATDGAILDLGFTGGSTLHFGDGQTVNDTDAGQTATAGPLGSAFVTTADTLDIVTGTQSLAGAVLKVWALIGRF